MIVDRTPPDTAAGPAKLGQAADPLSMDIAGKNELSLADKERLAEYTAGVRQMGVSGPLSEANVQEIGGQALNKFAPADMPKPEIVIAKPGELEPGDALVGSNPELAVGCLEEGADKVVRKLGWREQMGRDAIVQPEDAAADLARYL